MRGARLYVPVAGLGFILVVVFYIVDFDTGFRSANSAIFALIACCMVFAAVLCGRLSLSSGKGARNACLFGADTRVEPCRFQRGLKLVC